jgi:two-component system sensor histidine kinase CiaH
MSDPTTRLLRATRRRLFILTLGLIALLVIGIGAATAFVGLRVLDADVDRALSASVGSAVAALGGEMPRSSGESDTDESVPASADTFLLYLGTDGQLIANPSRVALAGLPDVAATSASATSGEDLRTVDAAGVDVRLLTMPVTSTEGGSPVGFVQGGFVLTLHDAESSSLVTTIVVVGAVGLLGAAVVTLLVTGRALGPIRQSFDSQRRFVADASHELRTPTALIRANAEVLDREGLVGDDGRALVDDIVAESDRLARLIADLLQLASADATGLVLDRRPVDLAVIAMDTVRQAEALAATRGVGVRMRPPTADLAPPAAGFSVVLGDRDRLIQLLLILLDNAFDHSPAGTTVTVGVAPSGKAVVLSVADEGPGIADADRDRIFEPFQRLPGVARDRAGGTGLGLAIARRIATGHDGTIGVDDAPGGGARFVVTLPASGRTPG